MTQFDYLGGPDDAVRLEIEDEEIKIWKRYSVGRSVFTRQPCSFSLTFGHAGVAADIVRKNYQNKEFALYVGKTVQFTGKIDDVVVDGGDDGHDVTLTGRDDLAQLHDAYIDADYAFTNITYVDLLQKAFKLAGYQGVSIVSDNDANRASRSGGKAKAPIKAVLVGETDPAGSSSGNNAKTVRFKPHQQWYARLKQEFDRAGIMLWAATENTFILSAPNADQAPLYRVVRQLGQPSDRNAVNIEHGTFGNRTSRRFSSCKVFVRGGGKKFGRTTTNAEYVDQEMTDLGIIRPLVLRDTKASTHDQAEKLARRKIADANREGWSLTYRVSGHTAPIIGGNGARAVWTPDTILDVQDELFGLTGSYYIESVQLEGGDEGVGTETELTLMRPDDLVFDAGEFE